VKRRDFIGLLGAAVAAWSLAVRAQQLITVARIGFLGIAPASASARRIEVLRAGLRDLGWVEGKNIVIESDGRRGPINCLNWPPSWRA
jgi:putative ABC transport system substrate-binding protein